MRGRGLALGVLVALARTGHAGTFFVDPAAGDDKAAGGKQAPWKTVARAVKALAPGDVVTLRGGVYHEAIAITASGTATAPITIRSAPGEVAILDGGLREFLDAPKTAWEPVKGGAPGEYRSTASYPQITTGDVAVVGNFADTMIPLHGYKFAADLRSANEYWTVVKTLAGTGIYLGPGVWLDPATHRIHARLAHTTLKSQVNYLGETDPRKLALVIGVDRTPLRIDGASHVTIADVVVRGSAVDTVVIADSDAITLDHVTIYGGAPAVRVRSTGHLRVVRSTVRGLAAPWSSRQSMKYRGSSPYLVVADSTLPQSHDWELANNVLADSHDGIVIDSIKTLRFHHNRVDNFNDDALYLTLAPRETVPEDIQIYENVITRSYTVLAFAERGRPAAKNPIGPGVYVYRNLFDLRDATYVSIPADAAADAGGTALAFGRMCIDHASPTWEPLYFYNNTVITEGKAWRDYYGAALVMGMAGTTRRLFNNIFVRLDGDPGTNLKGITGDLQVDGNLLWGVATGPAFTGDFFAAFRGSKIFAASKATYAPGWGARDLYADPDFAALADGAAADVALRPASPAIDAGVALPKTWPDSLRGRDKGAPDIGALPVGVKQFTVGP